MQLNLVEGFDLQALGHNSAEYLHLVFESIKLAKGDIYQYVADEEFTEIPTEGMPPRNMRLYGVNSSIRIK
jgi:gamma-glutamyltranspeptidase/glutathione hydrolase